jgi:hypothetical protein
MGPMQGHGQAPVNYGFPPGPQSQAYSSNYQLAQPMLPTVPMGQFQSPASQNLPHQNPYSPYQQPLVVPSMSTSMFYSPQQMNSSQPMPAHHTPIHSSGIYQQPNVLNQQGGYGIAGLEQQQPLPFQQQALPTQAQEGGFTALLSPSSSNYDGFAGSDGTFRLHQPNVRLYFTVLQ